ncbi:MAG: primosomal protein N' [Gemmatimonadales bacterium]|nr:primosomal protein N' [Gemmatimonadales bacterium]
MSDAFVDVALPLALERCLTYAVPDDLGGRAVAGARVVVPVKGREMIGIVVATGRDAPRAAARAVIAAPDPEPLLDRTLLALAKHIGRYYVAPPGLVLRAMLPAPLFSVGRPMVYVEAGAIPAGGAGPVIARMLGGTRGERGEKGIGGDWGARPVPLAAIRRSAGSAGVRLVQRLASEGRARIVTQPPRTAPPERRERVLELAQRFEHLLDRERRFARAPKQREAYEALEREGGHASAAQLERAGVSAAALRALIGAGVMRAVSVRRERDPFAALPASAPPGAPTGQQREAIASLDALGPGGVGLLFGVTGSGKTLVYLEYLRRLVDAGKSVIVLVPEIALTPQTVARFRGVFGDQVAVLHSALSDGERYDAWRALREGTRRVAVGARSAVFAAVPRLGAIVVDEEHDASYKQGEAPRYHARDVAVVRARLSGAVVVLGSATPSLESWSATERGTCRLITLPERIGARPLPPVAIVDLRAAPRSREAGPVPWSDELDTAVAGALGRGEQAMILLNRRGFSVFVQCPACGEVWECPRCSITLTYHRSPPTLRCHHCDHREPPPSACRSCGAATQRFRGVGTQQVEEFVASRFGGARIARMDVDTTSGKLGHHRILAAVERGEVDVLVGTQMIAKGLDFPRVTVVGVVDADVALNLPDFRSAERTFQLLTQVAGRAGRGPRGGRVIVQTRQPAHPAVTFAARHDAVGFAEAELAERRDPAYPPHVQLANCVISGTRERAVADGALAVSEWLRALFRARPAARADLVGPAPCPIARVRGRWRWHFLLRTRDAARLTRLIGYLADRAPAPRGVRLVVDRDPVALL